MLGSTDYQKPESMMSLSTRVGFDQDSFIKKSSEFLKEHPHYARGFCNGLTFIWIYYKSYGCEAIFFELYNSFLSRSAGSEITPLMLRFINNIKYLQWPAFYGSDLDQADFPNLINIVKPPALSLPELEYQITFNFTKTELQYVLGLLPADNKMILIYSPNHIIGVMKVGGIYHFYNANIGVEVYLDSEAELAKLIFTGFSITAPKVGKYLPLNLRVYKQPSQSAAAYFQPADIIEHLLKINPDTIRADAWPHCASFQYALARGDLESSTALMPSADIHMKIAGYSATDLAAGRGYEALLRPLHQAGGDINSALINAAIEDKDDAIAELIMLGAEVDYKDKDGLSALEHAVLLRRVNAVRILLNVGAATDSAYIQACKDGYEDIKIEFILSQQYRVAAAFQLTQTQSTAPLLTPGAS
ncbi:MAG: hypothetical protein K0Q57_1103, partial [Gammaproteobacteria bacterium]|nr:hypothetical protein [Gammaproteobacteria bacterium]